MSKLDRFAYITGGMYETYKAKNSDYGDSFSIIYGKFGARSSVIRLWDKLLRFETLLDKPPEVVDESVRDTLMDLATYAIMTVIEMDEEAKRREDCG